jgi:RNA polymerase sigma-70 factor (ECF subfamily)
MSQGPSPIPRDHEPSAAELPAVTRGSWHRFLETYEPLRTELYRYCRHLTRSPWDAEDLAQESMARAFVTLAQMGEAPAHPRAWLFRVASNLWIDQRRRRREEAIDDRDDEGERAEDTRAHRDPMAAREAAGTILGQLSPQERAAVVLKDALDLSLEEVAEALSTTPNAVKAALHRARGKLGDPPPPEAAAPTPPPAAIDAFCAAFNAGDLERLTALLLDTSMVEIVGASKMFGPAAAKNTALYGMLFGSKRMAQRGDDCGIDESLAGGVLPTSPRVEARAHRGRWILVHWYAHEGGEAVRSLSLVTTEGDRIVLLRNYFFTPDLIGEVCAELGVPFKPNGYRWSLPRR